MRDPLNQYRLLAVITMSTVLIVFGVLLSLLFKVNLGPAQIEAPSITTVVEEPVDDWDKVENGIHIRTGMKWDENLKYLERHCLACHSSKLITQNRATRDGWLQMIRWMQQTQGLHDLANDEKYVLDYLSKYYAPEKAGRRPNLDIKSIEWYVLDLGN